MAYPNRSMSIPAAALMTVPNNIQLDAQADIRTRW